MRTFLIMLTIAALTVIGFLQLATPEEESINEKLAKLEKETWQLINLARENQGLTPTKWDDELYILSKAHTQEMAQKGHIFHSPKTALYAENCWECTSSHGFDMDELARVIVNTWMSSPLHKAWILHKPLKTSVVSIVITPEGQYASWSFWKDEMGMGPDLVAKIAAEWRRETGEEIPWIEWLYMKGYLK